MEVILKQDVSNLGYTNDIVNVKNGYAQNYLIPQGLAIQATETNRKILKENLKQKAFKLEKLRNEAQTFGGKLDGITVKITTKASATGKIYGSVNSILIAEAIKEQFDVDVDRKRIIIDGESIKELGSFTVRINIHKEVKAIVNVEVVAE
ncbi:MAG: 50S ribosomal protein L9 [Bacteroidales bacterium]|jgi:large subunit ribosomal protein L9|nr:50S ribosomal protein L9 [Bacteroidales bacterium]